MRGIVVEHCVITRQLGLGARRIEKADKFEVAMALHTAADHRAVKHLARRTGGRAVPLVIVRHVCSGPA